MARIDGRRARELRSVTIQRSYLKYPHGSALIQVGDTAVLCTALVEEKVPLFLRGAGRGWVTAEYAMIPGATQTRTGRDAAKGRVSGRSQEIQRLIGRALRAVVDLEALGERTVWIDCDVLQADGGTRTAAVTGGFVALVEALVKLVDLGKLQSVPLSDFVTATSVGIVHGEPLLDLCYAEDSRAEVDMNVVMTAGGAFVEVQGTAEDYPFTREQMDVMLEMAWAGIQQLSGTQREALGPLADKVGV